MLHLLSGDTVVAMTEDRTSSANPELLREQLLATVQAARQGRPLVPEGFRIKTLADVVGINVRRLRDNLGWSQSDLARNAQEFGLRWTQSVVSSIEKGTRVLDLDELLLLCLVLKVTPDSLLAGDDTVRLNTSAHLGLQTIRSVLAGHDGALADAEDVPVGAVADLVTTVSSISKLTYEPEQFAIWNQLWPDINDRGRKAVLMDATQDAEKKAARSLNDKAQNRWRVSPVDIATAAHGLWGRSLTEERDTRIGTVDQLRQSEMDERAIQGLKGHSTRQLLNELKSYMETKVPVPWLPESALVGVPEEHQPGSQ